VALVWHCDKKGAVLRKKLKKTGEKLAFRLIFLYLCIAFKPILINKIISWKKNYSI
jgi:hypothetical protein